MYVTHRHTNFVYSFVIIFTESRHIVQYKFVQEVKLLTYVREVSISNAEVPKVSLLRAISFVPPLSTTLYDLKARNREGCANVNCNILREVRQENGCLKALVNLRYQPTDRPTDRPTDQPTNQPTNQTTNQPNNQLHIADFFRWSKYLPIEKIPHYDGNQIFITIFNTTLTPPPPPPFFFIPTQKNAVQTFSSYFFKPHFNMILSFSLRSSKIPLCFGSATKNLYAFLFAPYLPPSSPRPNQLILFHSSPPDWTLLAFHNTFLFLYLTWFVISDFNVFWAIKDITTKTVYIYFMQALY